MRCSYCTDPLPEEEDTLPNVFLYNKHHGPMLALHAECIRQVLKGLTYAEKLVTN